MWYFINRSQKDPRCGSFHQVQRVVDGQTQESRNQDDTEDYIFEETEYRFQLAAQAPIESTRLIEQLGYLGDSAIAEQIIEGKYDIPDTLDDATAMLVQEIGRIGIMLTNGDITITITPEEFQYFWKKVREGTASSPSGIHYGHYKAAAHSERLSGFLAKKITLISRTGCPPSRWSYGLTVMLEKVAGIALVNKLRAILLMEADFNFHNKLIFGKRMLDQARSNGIIPPEQYSEKQSTAEDGTFDKILQADISRQRRMRMSIVSADAANCYDRINHCFAALLFLCLGVAIGPTKAMLQTIQMMKFYLRTGWGESTRYIGGDPLTILHGMCQGNGAAPSAWLVLSSFLVSIYKSMGYGSRTQAPITRAWLDVMGVLFVDDTDLYIMDECIKSGYDLWDETQEATTAWGKLLIATGGALKPEKCFYYLIDYEWQDDGTWEYTTMVDLPPITVPLPDGTAAPIEQLSAEVAKKTLGIWTNPAGCSITQLGALYKSLKTWTNRLSAGKLPAKWAWVSHNLHLWPKLRYGLGTNSSPVATLADAEEPGGALRKLYRKMLPFLGVNRNIKSEWRHLPHTFGGIGLKRLLSEVVIARINLFIQHYKTPSTLGAKLSHSLEALQLELGTNKCPLQLPFKPLGPIATDCWCKSFWEGLDSYGFKMEMDYEEIPLPRQDDELLIDIFLSTDPDEDDLRSLQRCRQVWESLFLSDLVCANGRLIDRKFLSPPPADHESLSSYEFAEERPTASDWAFWAEFWGRYTLPGRYLRTPLGEWIAPTHRKWKWTFSIDSGILFCRTPSGVHRYMPRLLNRTRGEQLYSKISDASALEPYTGQPCTVEVRQDGMVRLLNYGSNLATGPTQPDTFFSFLREWGGEWMWTNVVNEGKHLRWVVDALKNGTAIWVTDGSYNRTVAPHISGAGWLIYCTSCNRKLYGSFVEYSAKAGSYRGELLGLLAIHVLLAAMEEFYNLPATYSKICCDNQGALYKSKESRRRIPVGASQADIKRSLRNVKTGMHAKLTYEWVESHQDRLKLWHQLSIEQQLNCFCDSLAKSAVTSGLGTPRPHRSQQRLPRESVAVFVAGRKQTSDVAKEVRFALGLVDAERFYTAPPGAVNDAGRRGKGGLGWSKASFDAVAWEALDATLDTKGQMYCQWLSKQSSGCCGTQQMVSYWDKSRDNSCPNCGRRETASHLNLCYSTERSQLLTEMATNLEQWLLNNHTHPELAYWIPRYIKLRGTRRLSDMPFLSPEMRVVAASQDLIPWTCFMEGKVSEQLLLLQSHTLARSSSRLTISDWAKKLISQILQISHAQWVFRNASLHDKTTGYLRTKRRNELLLEIDKLSQLDPTEVPAANKYLLEMDFSALRSDTLDQQSYWLLAMRAAVKAGQRNRARQKAATASQRRAQRRVAAARGVGTATRQPILRHKRSHQQVPGAAETLKAIYRDMGLDKPPVRRRGSPASEMAAQGDNKRRKPD